MSNLSSNNTLSDCSLAVAGNFRRVGNLCGENWTDYSPDYNGHIVIPSSLYAYSQSVSVVFHHSHCSLLRFKVVTLFAFDRLHNYERNGDKAVDKEMVSCTFLDRLELLDPSSFREKVYITQKTVTFVFCVIVFSIQTKLLKLNRFF